MRRFIHDGRLPTADAVRIEELVNYFSYGYPEPGPGHPFSVTAEVASCPWNSEHQLVQIGLKGRSIDKSELPPANLVFLIDVSGSMHSRLPLVKSGLKLLVKQMRPQDRIAIAAYADASYSSVTRRARRALGNDPHGYRTEFVQLVVAAEAMRQ